MAARLRSFLGVVLLMTLPVGSAVAKGLDASAAPKHVRAVLAAFEKSATTGERLLVRNYDLDPWALADDLLALGRKDVADRLPALHRPSWRAPLMAFLAAPRASVVPVRAAFWQAHRHAEGGAWESARAVLKGKLRPKTGLLLGRWLELRASAEASLGNTDAALQAYTAAAKVAHALGWRAGEFTAWFGAQDAYDQRSDMIGLRTAFEQLIRLFEADDDPVRADAQRGHLAGVLVQLGEADKGFALFDEVLARFRERPGREARVALIETSLAMSLLRRGAYARALSLARDAIHVFRELKLVRYVTYALSVEVGALVHLGGERNHELALELSKQIEALTEPQSREHADLLVDRAMPLGQLGWYDDAETALAKAAAIYAKVGDKAAQAIALVNRGNVVHAPQGHFAAALVDYMKARELAETQAEPLAWIDLGVGEACTGLKQWPEALAAFGASSARAEALDQRDLQFFVEVGRARAYLELKRLPEAQTAVERAYALLAGRTAGLGDESFASARGEASRTRLYALGVQVARALADDERLVAALEHARAAALLESLGGRERLHAVALPADLAKDEALQQATLVRERQALALAKARGRRLNKKDFSPLQAAERALAASSDRVRSEAKLLAGLTLPRSDSLAALQDALGKSQALLWYTFIDDGLLASILTSKGLKTQRLGKPADVWEWIEALYIGDPHVERKEFEGARSKLRTALVDAIQLPKNVRRVLLSPAGELAHLPWPWLWRHREGVEVGLVPSGTTWRLLAEVGDRRGAGVLAVGDPVYKQELSGVEVAVLGRTKPLERLEASGVEVKAVAAGKHDVLLVREKATKAALLKALAEKTRRASVHLACHGLLHPHTSGLSALALTPTADDDGFLRAMDVLGLHVNTDLVVLSACSVGRGKLAHGEGLMGLTRAFMAAGAPRVLASLERVDDEATALLMRAFYKAWHTPGVSTAAALKRAQDVVRKVPKWRHPYYWANWVLWGLPD